MGSPEVSKRVAWAVHQVDLSREDRQAIAAAVEAADEFDDLPDWVQSFVHEREDGAPPSQEWRRSGRLQLRREDLQKMSPAGIDEARKQGRLRKLLSGG